MGQAGIGSPGRRSRQSDARPAARKRDRARADRGPVPAADRAAERPIVGAEALARSAVARSATALFARPRQRVSTSGCRGWSSARRCAAPRCGKARSRISSCRSTSCPRTCRATVTSDGCSTRSQPPASIRRGSRSRSPKARCWSTSRRSRPASRGCAKRASRIAVDDFGTGYASLAYLTSLPLDVIKIDRGLIADIVGGERDRIVVKAMIRLARELDLRSSSKASKAPPSWRCSPTGAATSTRASSAPER